MSTTELERDNPGELMQDAADKIKRLQGAIDGDEIVAGMATLFGSRFHLDSKCGSCGGPLECDRDAICLACTDAMEIERLTSERDEARTVAINLHRALSHHESTPEIDESYGWLL